MKGTIGLLALSMLAAPGFAQDYSPPEVRIDPATRTAMGALTATRNSSTPDVYIGCEIHAWSRKAKNPPNPPKPDLYQGTCSAYDIDSRASCVTWQSDFIDVIASLNSASYIIFEWDENGNCKRLRAVTRSDFLAPHPTEYP